MSVDIERSVEDHIACAIYMGYSDKPGVDLPWDTWDNALQEWERRRYRRAASRARQMVCEFLPRTSWRFIA